MTSQVLGNYLSLISQALRTEFITDYLSAIFFNLLDVGTVIAIIALSSILIF